MFFRMIQKSKHIFFTFRHIAVECTRLTDGQTDRQTDRQTELSSLDLVCIPCSAVKTAPHVHFEFCPLHLSCL